MASLDAEPRKCEESPGNGKVKESRIFLEKEQVTGETVFRKPGFVFVLPSVVEQKRETEARDGPCGVAKDGVAGTGDQFDARAQTARCV